MGAICVLFENKEVDDSFYELNAMHSELEFLDKLASENKLAPLRNCLHWDPDSSPDEYYSAEAALKTVEYFLEVLPNTSPVDFEYGDSKDEIIAEMKDLKAMLDRAVELGSDFVFAAVG